MNQLSLAVDALEPHVAAVALIGARLLPVAFLCPLLGGPQAPAHVKLGLALALATFLHLGAGIAPRDATLTLDWVGWAAREAVLGTTLGLIASLPFEAARIGGRVIDLFRGSSAEAALPLSGTKEAASGDALHSLLVALAATGLIMPVVLGALFRSFAWVPLGRFGHTEEVALEAARLVGGAFATGLAIGAPFAALSLAIDTLLGLASRALAGMNLQDTAAPLKILSGGGLLWLAIGVLAQRVQALALEPPHSLRHLIDLSGGPTP